MTGVISWVMYAPRARSTTGTDVQAFSCQSKGLTLWNPPSMEQTSGHWSRRSSSPSPPAIFPHVPRPLALHPHIPIRTRAPRRKPTHTENGSDEEDKGGGANVKQRTVEETIRRQLIKAEQRTRDEDSIAKIKGGVGSAGNGTDAGRIRIRAPYQRALTEFLHKLISGTAHKRRETNWLDIKEGGPAA
ncbi:hypothetical protein DFH06DRAFT_1308144 [Mycena polygramma]|nr:hypothetical protein DFH06DRAFT_1308144 [Mycena polygramma]